MSQTTMREPLPDGVVADILGRLPVKSLTRFRCVSKFYDSIITDPTFITKHFELNLNQSESLISTNTHSGYLLYTTMVYNRSPSSKHLCTVACNSDGTLTQVSRFEIPSLFEKYDIVGFCNGLFCVASCYGRHRIKYLWNPSIRMFKELPAAPFPDKDSKKYMRSVGGLAYNSQNNVFKFLRLLYDFESEAEAEAEIYNLSTDSWRKVVISMQSLGYEPNFGTIDSFYSPCIFLNGALHTLARTRRHYFILSFDVNDDSFRKIELRFNYSDLGWNCPLGLHKGSLAVFSYTHIFSFIVCEIWVMEEYGAPDSWTRKYAVQMPGFGVDLYGRADNGELLMKNATELISFDPESKKHNTLAIRVADWVDSTANSMESWFYSMAVRGTSAWKVEG